MVLTNKLVMVVVIVVVRNNGCIYDVCIHSIINACVYISQMKE